MAKPKKHAPKELPLSVTSFKINLVALACFLGGLVAVNQVPAYEWAGTRPQAHLNQLIFLLACWSLPVIVLEHFVFKRLGAFQKERLSIKRTLIKALGLYITLAICGLIYWIFPEYRSSFYTPYWALLEILVPVVLIGCLPYFYLSDGFVDELEDSYLALGKLLLASRDNPAFEIFKQHMLGWLVKLFFLPLMTVYFYNSTRYFSSLDIERVFTSFMRFYDFAWELIFAIDLVIVTAGYLLTLKLLDSHIRTSEPTVKGWLVAIICYQPFWGAISVGYLAYNKDNYEWGAWVAGNDTLAVVWGSLILMLIAIYSLSSVAFGIRFSNLTHRGIITTGPYRYTKHPAYLSKNLSWWLIGIPFISAANDMLLVIQSCLMLLGLNLIYYLRAVTEERHLSWDETYRDYQRAMEKRGILGRFERLTGSADNYQKPATA